MEAPGCQSQLGPHALHPRLPPSSGLGQDLPRPEEGPGVVILSGRPHGCIRFGLLRIPEVEVDSGVGAIEGGMS